MNSTKPNELLSYIDTLIKKEEFDVAHKLLQEFPFDESNIDSSNYLNAKCELHRENYKEALNYINKISAENTNILSHHLKIFCQSKLGKHEDIVKQYFNNMPVYQKYPEHFRLIIANSCEKVKAYDTAKGIYNDILKKNENCAIAINNLALQEYKNNENIPNQLRYYVEGNLNFANCKNNKDDDKEIPIEAINNLAMCYIKNNKIREGLVLLEGIVDPQNNNNEGSKKKRKLKFSRLDKDFQKIELNYLNTLINNDKVETAQKYITKSLEMDRCSTMALLLLANTYINTGNYEEAASICEIALKRDDAVLNGKLYRALKNTSENISVINQKIYVSTIDDKLNKSFSKATNAMIECDNQQLNNQSNNNSISNFKSKKQSERLLESTSKHSIQNTMRDEGVNHRVDPEVVDGDNYMNDNHKKSDIEKIENNEMEEEIRFKPKNKSKPNSNFKPKEISKEKSPKSPKSQKSAHNYIEKSDVSEKNSVNNLTISSKNFIEEGDHDHNHNHDHDHDHDEKIKAVRSGKPRPRHKEDSEQNYINNNDNYNSNNNNKYDNYNKNRNNEEDSVNYDAQNVQHVVDKKPKSSRSKSSNRSKLSKSEKSLNIYNNENNNHYIKSRPSDKKITSISVGAIKAKTLLDDMRNKIRSKSVKQKKKIKTSDDFTYNQTEIVPLKKLVYYSSDEDLYIDKKCGNKESDLKVIDKSPRRKKLKSILRKKYLNTKDEGSPINNNNNNDNDSEINSKNNRSVSTKNIIVNGNSNNNNKANSLKSTGTHNTPMMTPMTPMTPVISQTPNAKTSFGISNFAANKNTATSIASLKEDLKLKSLEIPSDNIPSQLDLKNNTQYLAIHKLYTEENYTDCKNLIADTLDNNSHDNETIKHIEIILANIHYKEKKYDKSIQILTKHQNNLNQQDMLTLLNCYKFTEVTNKYKDTLIEYYNKYNNSEDILLEIIKLSVYFSDIETTKNFVENKYIKLKSEKNELKNKDWETIIDILFSNSLLNDYSYSVLEMMKSMKYGNDPYYKYLLGRYYLKKNRVNSAYENLVQVEKSEEMQTCQGFHKYFGKIQILLGNFIKAVKYFKQALKFDGNDSSSALHIGECFIKMEKFDRAKKYLNLSAKIDPHPEKNIWLIYSQGRIHLVEEELDKALDCFNRCLEINPNSYKAYHRKAWIYIEQGDLESYKIAEELLEKCCSVEATYFPGYYDLFKTKLHGNKKSEADNMRATIEKNLQQYPHLLIEYALYILTYFSDIDTAQRYFHMAIMKEHKYKNIDKILKYIECLSDKKEFEKAIGAYQSVIMLYPKEYSVYSSLNKLLVFQGKQGKYNDAIKNVLEYLKIDSLGNEEKLLAKYDVAELYYSNGDYEKALEWYEEVFKNLSGERLGKDDENDGKEGKKPGEVSVLSVIKKVGVTLFKLNRFDKACEFLVQFSDMKRELNVCLLVAYIMLVYQDNKSGAKVYVNREYDDFPENEDVCDIVNGCASLKDVDISDIVSKIMSK